MSHATTTSVPCGPARPSTSPGHVVAGLLLGALCGAVLVSGMILATALFQYDTVTSLAFAAVALPVALVAWLVGLTVIGGPIWWLLRKSNSRPTRLAALVGGVATALLMGGWSATLALVSGDSNLRDLLPILEFGLFGCVVGWVVARVAYGRQGGVR